jgi:hypothetical protein
LSKLHEYVCGGGQASGTDLTKANAEPNSPSKAEWEPIKLFRTIGTKAKKINFDSIPATKKKRVNEGDSAGAGAS